MLDSESGDEEFPEPIAGEPDIARVPVMVDSSKWAVIEAGLKCLQGKGNRQFDQPQGRRREIYCSRRKLVRRYGAAVVVMAFDERGQADSSSEKSRFAPAPTRS